MKLQKKGGSLPRRAAARWVDRYHVARPPVRANWYLFVSAISREFHREVASFREAAPEFQWPMDSQKQQLGSVRPGGGVRPLKSECPTING